MLRNLIATDDGSIDEQIQKREDDDLRHNRLMDKLSELEQEVYVLYIKKYHYDEIRDELRKSGRKGISTKTIDNSLFRIRTKSRNLFKNEDFS